MNTEAPQVKHPMPLHPHGRTPCEVSGSPCTPLLSTATASCVHRLRRSAPAQQGKAKKGTILYRLVWEGCPPELVWYEPEKNVEGTRML